MSFPAIAWNLTHGLLGRAANLALAASGRFGASSPPPARLPRSTADGLTPSAAAPARSGPT
jgi:hypothetical protein